MKFFLYFLILFLINKNSRTILQKISRIFLIDIIITDINTIQSIHT